MVGKQNESSASTAILDQIIKHLNKAIERTDDTAIRLYHVRIANQLAQALRQTKES